MKDQLQEISQLVDDRNAAKEMIRHTEQRLVDQLFSLPSEIKMAIALDIVKPSFPVPHRVLVDLRADMLKDY